MSGSKPLQFTATEQQLRTLIALTVHASRPTGIGVMHYKERSMGDCEEIAMYYLQPNSQSAISLDYFEGRMVKLCLLPVREEGDTITRWEGEGDSMRLVTIKPPFIPNRYEFNIEAPRADYQSWARKYPTLESLLKAADIIH